MNLLHETGRDDLKRLINEKLVASCWLLTSLKSKNFFFVVSQEDNKLEPSDFV